MRDATPRPCGRAYAPVDPRLETLYDCGSRPTIAAVGCACARSTATVRVASSRALERVKALRSRLSPDAWALVAIAATVLLVHLGELLGLLIVNPIGDLSGVGHASGALLRGGVGIDPNIGYTSQALGHRAALDLLGLHVPWWNPFDGTGTSLAGEWQSAALFPPTLLLVFSNGQLYEHMLLEIIGGGATYLLLRRIKLGRWASLAAGIVFGLNGTFSWVAHAPVNPVAFLPLLLLGLEYAYSASATRRRGGWWLISIALALSLYAGFPEVAYIDGVLAFGWLAWRWVTAPAGVRRALTLKVIAGGLVGLLLAAPILVAGGSFLTHSSLGAHTGGTAGGLRINRYGLPQLLMPYIYGPIFAYIDPRGQLLGLWSEVGGYLSVTPVLFAVAGLLSRGRRGLKLMLVIWIVLAFARTYGQIPLLGHVLGLLPDMNNVEFMRWGPASLEMAVIVLAAIGLDDVISNPGRGRRFAAVAAGCAIVVALALVLAHGVSRQLGAGYHHLHYFELAGAWALGLIVIAAVAALKLRSPRWRGPMLALLVAGDAFAMFAVGVLPDARTVTLDQAPVRFLQSHLGTQRYFSFGPIAPNYGSYWGIPQLNNNDYPPNAYARYVRDRLDPTASPNIFEPVGVLARSQQPITELERNISGYRAAGVAYVLTPVGHPLPQSKAEFQLVKRTPTTLIYHLAGAAALMQASNPRCHTVAHGYTSATVTCPVASRFTYRETDFPGWTATVSGRATPITAFDGDFQSITVPAGTHTVRFAYQPPDIELAGLAFLIGLIWLVAGTAWSRARPSRSPQSGEFDARPRQAALRV